MLPPDCVGAIHFDASRSDTRDGIKRPHTRSEGGEIMVHFYTRRILRDKRVYPLLFGIRPTSIFHSAR
jgi:hypothetical protein